MTESALESPYAVASTTFPNAPEPSVFPEDRHKTVIPHPVSLPQTGPKPAFLKQHQF